MIRPGYITRVTLDRVIDGDTVEVSLNKRFTVRITDGYETFDTPELRGVEREWGVRAKDYITELLNNAEEILLYVNTDGKEDVGDLFCIGGRIVGEIYIDGENIADIMSREGYNKNAGKEA